LPQYCGNIAAISLLSIGQLTDPRGLQTWQ